MPEHPSAPDERLTATRTHFGLSQREAARLAGWPKLRCSPSLKPRAVSKFG
jgi:hypothetical protein